VNKKRVIVAPPGVSLILTRADDQKERYDFHFYQATWTDKKSPRYMCYSNTVGCAGISGEGLGWSRAMTDCLMKLIQAKVIKEF
jgi:hypothetical protein